MVCHGTKFGTIIQVYVPWRYRGKPWYIRKVAWCFFIRVFSKQRKLCLIKVYCNVLVFFGLKEYVFQCILFSFQVLLVRTWDSCVMASTLIFQPTSVSSSPLLSAPALVTPTCFPLVLRHGYVALLSRTFYVSRPTNVMNTSLDLSSRTFYVSILKIML